MAQGDRASIQGLNRVGLERNGGSRDDLAVLREVYRVVFSPAGTEAAGKVFKDRVAHARGLVGTNQRGLDFVAFIEASERGIAPHHRSASDLE
jgi:UDP-N-acetylglucosamine acyltransferase